MTETLFMDLAHAVTRYDRAQSKGKSYNPNALAIYLGRAADVATDCAAGIPLGESLERQFNDRLLDRVRIYLTARGHVF